MTTAQDAINSITSGMTVEQLRALANTVDASVGMPIRLYAEMKVGQVSFWENKGQIRVSPQTYALHSNAQEALSEGKP